MMLECISPKAIIGDEEFAYIQFEQFKGYKRYVNLFKAFSQFLFSENTINCTSAMVLGWENHYKNFNSCYNSISTCIRKYFYSLLECKKVDNQSIYILKKGGS